MLFDRYVIVDWSANSKPKTGADSIWIGAASQPHVAPWKTENPSTRAAAEGSLSESLTADIAAGLRVLVGFDFPLGYPAGCGEALSPEIGPPWRVVWQTLRDEIRDDERNHNNRFEVAARLNRRLGFGSGPFWGLPNNRMLDGIAATKGAAHGLRHYRHTECRVRGVQEVWKLWGNGSVGSQALLGIPRVEALRRKLNGHAQVWPFDHGFALFTARPSVVFAEIWPGIIPLESRSGVKDQVQVESLAAHFMKLDEDGHVARLFARPSNLSDREEAECVSAEGWILGV